MKPQHEKQSFIVALFRVDSFSSKKFTKENDSSGHFQATQVNSKRVN